MENDLIGEVDAQIWVKKWMETIQENPSIPTDEGTMLAWFASAIMSGYDKGRHFEQERNIVEKIREIIFRSAGAATAIILRDHPNYVFPSDQVHEVVERVCTEFGIPKTEGY